MSLYALALAASLAAQPQQCDISTIAQHLDNKAKAETASEESYLPSMSFLSERGIRYRFELALNGSEALLSVLRYNGQFNRFETSSNKGISGITRILKRVAFETDDTGEGGLIRSDINTMISNQPQFDDIIRQGCLYLTRQEDAKENGRH